MPKTKMQAVIFTLMMVFCMVYVMTVFVIASGVGELNYHSMLLAVKEMWLEFVIVFVIVFFVITPLARKGTGRLVTGEVPPIVHILVTQGLTVAMIVLCITLIATVFHQGFTADWFMQWITTWSSCFPVALCVQIFYVGPLVRKIFTVLFHEKEELES